jgi:hypothetical protein
MSPYQVSIHLVTQFLYAENGDDDSSQEEHIEKPKPVEVLLELDISISVKVFKFYLVTQSL